MFYNLQPKQNRTIYKRFLNAAAILGNLNRPNSVIPQISSRASEDIFCRAFNAEDLGRKDVSIDAYKPNDGIGIKTFQGPKMQKVAEFNNRKKYPIPPRPLQIAYSIAEYRNKRLSKTANDLSLDRMLYHYVYRNKNQEIQIFEQEMSTINIHGIQLLKSTNPEIIKFSDGISRYSFNKSKSVLYLSFSMDRPLDSFIYQYNKRDFEYFIENILPKSKNKESKNSLVLKLFNQRKNIVELKSGLNQWRASGRERHYDEVYIPIPIIVHRENPGFFPKRDQTFRIETNTGEKFLAKVCQENSKALMSNPNKSLGKWILRDILKIQKGALVTVRHLERAKVDSIKIEKFDENNFRISPFKDN